MDMNEILANLRSALGKITRRRLIISSPHEKVADVPLVYAVLLALSSPFACVLAFLLGMAKHYAVSFEQELERRS